MIEQVSALWVVDILSYPGHDGALLLSPLAEDAGAFAIAVEAWIRATEQLDNACGIARIARIVRMAGRASSILRFFCGNRQVRHPGIAGDQKIGLIDEGRKFWQRHFRLGRRQHNSSMKSGSKGLQQVGRSRGVRVAW